MTAERVPPYLRGDALRLQQVLLNLLGNALKFTEAGRCSCAGLRTTGTGWCRWVEDTGIGIASQHLERILTPSRRPMRPPRAVWRHRPGHHHLAAAGRADGRHHQRAQHRGVGTTFTVCLPLPVGQALAAVANVSQGGLPQMRMLVVDDVPANIELLQDPPGPGAPPDHRGTGWERPSVVRHEAGFDVVLMDLQMPGMDGLEATRRIRAFEQAQRRKPVPVIALSASVLEQDRRNARAAGMDGFASKPLEPARLFREIARC